jgi:parallel beta-helix repeat protein
MNRAVFVSLTILCLLFVSSVTGLIQVVKADGGTIYIRTDGSIDPPTSPISTLDNITYTLTDNINGSLYIERDNITFDGAGHDVMGGGSGLGVGVTLDHVNNVTVENMKIGTVGTGIWLYSSSQSVISGNNITGAVYSGILIAQSSNNNTISSNNITNSTVGIYLESSPNNTVSENNIETYDNIGITLHSSSNNVVSGNNVTNNYFGIQFIYSDNITIVGNTVANSGFVGIDLISSNCTICHNNFMNNTNQFYSSGLPNVWDNGFEGNYWSDYNGTDNNQDGIGDTPYIIDASNTDHYPLMGTFQSFNVSIWFELPIRLEEVDIISNSTIREVEYDYTTDAQSPTGLVWYLDLLGLVGQNGTVGFCRITFPNDMINSSSYPVKIGYIGDNNFTMSRVLSSNGTHTTLYFTYDLPTPYWGLSILPEFPSFLILPLFFITTLLAVIICKRTKLQKLKSLICTTTKDRLEAQK